MTRKELRDIYEECQRHETCIYCPYEDDFNCANLWDFTGCIPVYHPYEELERIAKKEGLLYDD